MRVLVLVVLGAYAVAMRPVNAAPAEPLTILALGDSLTAGYQLPQGQGFAPVLERTLTDEGYAVRVIDGGVSGDTSAGGLARLDWMTAEVPDVAIVELGANDALRGQPPAETQENLARIIAGLKDKGVRVLLAGMLAPPNMGAEYADAFDAIYPTLATRFGVALYPFFLDGVAARPDLLLSDGMHPTAEGVRVIVHRILPMVEKLLNEELATR